jgi:hypothetical protein
MTIFFNIGALKEKKLAVGGWQLAPGFTGGYSYYALSGLLVLHLPLYPRFHRGLFILRPFRAIGFTSAFVPPVSPGVIHITPFQGYWQLVI